MDIQTLTSFFLQYGAIFIFLIVLFEYLNLPGFPAGVIMPMAGIWAAKGNISFLAAMVITVSAGLLGSWILYFFGRIGGALFLPWYVKRFPKQELLIQKNLELLRKKGAAGVFISKLIPMIRTVISIPAGMIKMDFLSYSISSAGGIFIWNFVLVGAGYWMGDAALNLFT
ncbi:DedA family protein [Clostridium transplantifaecale]|uniref:DedA family protein n=1 Tax=Clostridium transplantifaecale TaxID=2479838 RepID=UPI000F62E5B7|nr:DedA family protein [Clostridium transplantifaecale]